MYYIITETWDWASLWGAPKLLPLHLLKFQFHFKNISLTCHILQVVQEYERAVIFRLGRLMQGGAKGPGEYSVVQFHRCITG